MSVFFYLFIYNNLLSLLIYIYIFQIDRLEPCFMDSVFRFLVCVAVFRIPYFSAAVETRPPQLRNLIYLSPAFPGIPHLYGPSPPSYVKFCDTHISSFIIDPHFMYS